MSCIWYLDCAAWNHRKTANNGKSRVGKRSWDERQDKLIPVLNYVMKHCVLKAYGEVEVWSSILDFGIRYRWVVNFTLRPIYLSSVLTRHEIRWATELD
jgi:hypothetical protein